MNRLEFHEIIRPSVSQSFFEKTVNLWNKCASGHIGTDMYQHHAGHLGKESMSGVITWAQYEKMGSLPKEGKRLFLETIHGVADEIGRGLPVVEFGPGTMEDSQTLINATRTREYIPVDCSVEIIRHARELVSFTKACVVRPAVVDFFSRNNCPLIDEPSLGVLLGLTIGNIPGPIPVDEPRLELVQGFNNLIRAMPRGGYLLVSADVCQDGELNKARYNEPWHRTFSINHLYRMAEELPMLGFDPGGFTYEPVWHEHCGLLAHTIRATEDQSFEMGECGEHCFSINRGDVFHCDNSYKFRPDFFEDCAEDAGLEVIECLKGQGSIRLYLFHVPAIEARNSFNAPKSSFLHQTGQSFNYPSGHLAVMQETLRSVA
jgi:uncharacterized SAM-dependent methyltransferase